ncbi:uncharacterized protein PEZ65_001896 [Lycodopsis pacificus]
MSDSSRSLEDVRTLLHSSAGVDLQQKMKFYNSWAESYDQDCDTLNYRAPHQMVKLLFDNFSGRPEQVQVLDVACGSGWVANLMVELGFKHFVGVDGSQGMLDQAAKTGLYKELKLASLGTEPLPALSGMFDVVMIVGGLRYDHVPVSVIRELCLAAKPGGHICMSRNGQKSESGNKYKVSMEKELQLMEEEGLWSHVITKEMGKYMIDVYDNCEDVQNEKYVPEKAAPMVELGFKHFVGVDGSQGMLDQAAKTGLYKELKLASLGTEPLPALSGMFDVVMIVGGLRYDHVPVSVIRELCHAAKPGGHICMSRNGQKSESGNKYKVSMEKELQLMEEEGLWSHVITKEMGKYMIDVYDNCEDVQNEKYVPGTMYLYRKSLN